MKVYKIYEAIWIHRNKMYMGYTYYTYILCIHIYPCILDFGDIGISIYSHNLCTKYISGCVDFGVTQALLEFKEERKRGAVYPARPYPSSHNCLMLSFTQSPSLWSDLMLTVIGILLSVSLYTRLHHRPGLCYFFRSKSTAWIIFTIDFLSHLFLTTWEHVYELFFCS